MALKEKLEKYRKLIFTLELAGLLHDIGKLDSRFIDYRKKWQKNIDGCNYRNDPHDDFEKPYFDFDPILKKKEFESLNNILSKNLSCFCGGKELEISGHYFNLEIPFKEIMHKHTSAQADHIASFLKLGDSIDSAYDRNNPLFCEEQMNSREIYRSTVFGFETPLNVEVLDKERELLYEKLNFLLPSYLSGFDSNFRAKIFDECEKAFTNSLSDTCRPANDITLWQHCYVTSALTKVFFLHFLIYGEKLNEYDDGRFALFGIGWDGLSFISNGQKIGDIVVRKKIIHDLKKGIKEILEFKYPIGINIYDDDNGISFVIPAILDSKWNEYKDLLNDIKKEVIDLSNNVTDGEVLPVYSEKVKKTHFIMDIVNVIEDLKKKSIYPYDTERGTPTWINKWNDTVGEICNICKKRPVKKDKKVCEICEERRKLAQKEYGDKQESIFTDEIADKNDRICLIVAKFNLMPWLSGDMLWTLFVKGAQSLEEAVRHLGKIKDFYNADKERIDAINSRESHIDSLKFNYEKIKEYIDICANEKGNAENKEYSKYINFLFLRHGIELPSKKEPSFKELDNLQENWVNKIDKEMEIEKRFKVKPSLCNYLLTKNHTPSRLLNIWNTTRDFLKVDLFKSDGIKRILPSFRRLVISFDKPAADIMPMENACYEAEINGRKIELFRKDDKVFLVNAGREELNLNEKKEGWLNKEINIYSNEFEKKENPKKAKIVNIEYSDKSFYPYRIITASPDLLMVLVPADKAVEITEFIYDQYMLQFGKVLGRLPLSIGHIFFPKRMPMFVVLEAGKRMEENFSLLYKEYDKREDFTIRVDKIENGNNEKTTKIFFDNGLEWKTNLFLGNQKEKDYFHPYFIVKNGEKLTERKTYFKTFLGDLVHFSEIKNDDVIKICPAFYDFEFLDSTTRRYDIILEDRTSDVMLKRKSNTTQLFTKPYSFDEFKYKFVKFWNIITNNEENQLMTDITDTKLRNIESLWLTKLKKWRVDPNKTNSEEFKEWENLINTALIKEFPEYVNKIKDPDFNWIKNVIFQGLFFDCLELNLRILKNKVKE